MEFVPHRFQRTREEHLFMVKPPLFGTFPSARTLFIEPRLLRAPDVSLCEGDVDDQNHLRWKFLVSVPTVFFDYPARHQSPAPTTSTSSPLHFCARDNFGDDTDKGD